MDREYYIKKLNTIKEAGNYRVLRNIEHNGFLVHVDGKEMLNLSSNDYLGLASNPRLAEEFRLEMDTAAYGYSAVSSRLLSGNHQYYKMLEDDLSDWYGKEAALVFNSGYHANIGILPALSRKHDLVIADKLVHASIIDGIRLSQAQCVRYRHQDYKQLERQLQREIDMMEMTHPGMDEYQYDLDPIEHDPWELTSYLTTLHDDYTRGEVQGTLQDTFNKQYKLTTWVEPQIRYRVVVVPSPVPPYFTTTLEPYVYYILHVKLENRGLETVIREELDSDQWARYEVLQDTKGGRPYLFNGSLSWGGSDGSGEPGIDYQVPAEALTDPEFAAMLEEAEKYLGTPYVWGGSSPETGFDCSGYVCWVLNESGWDVGRTTANGLWQQSTKISEQEAKPGDLVFFEGTYDTPGASHVGIYVGDGMMISAGDPIKYSNIHSSYWDGHLLGFGRIPK